MKTKWFLLIACSALHTASAFPWKDVSVFTPPAEYPESARLAKLSGSGVYTLQFNHSTGKVVRVQIIQSTGSPVLDGYGLAAFKRWRVKPGTISKARVPCVWALPVGWFYYPPVTDVGVTESIEKNVHKRTLPPKDYLQLSDADAADRVINAPRPEYPLIARRNFITGSGVFVFIIDRDGSARVDVAQSTGSRILDDAALEGFRRWRFKPGPPCRIRTPITFNVPGAYEHYMKEHSL